MNSKEFTIAASIAKMKFNMQNIPTRLVANKAGSINNPPKTP